MKPLPRRSPKILVLHASVGAGHTRAAQAVAAALAQEAPGAEVRVVDALDLARPLFSRLYSGGYLKLVERAPALFGMFYDYMDRERGRCLGDRLRRRVQRWGAAGLLDLLEDGGWDAVVHTHFLAPELACALRREGRLSAPQLVVVTDFDAHRIWAHDPVERYCVASTAAAASLRAHGVDDEEVELTGIPVDAAFAEKTGRDAARRELGLCGGYPVVVQASGGHGTGPVEEVYRALLASTIPSQLVVVCGRNEDARKRLRSIRPPSRHRVKVLGYTDGMRRLMAAADLLVTKPGGLTVSEALACGLPMALVNPIPGQEERNADFLLENGAAVKASSPAALTGKVETLLSSPARLEEMRRRAARLGRPRAAVAVARQALELARGRAAAAAATDSRLAAARTPVLMDHWLIPGLYTSSVARPDAATAK
ncbi:MAG: glycosyltransferase [Elusimicrobiota bacterium]|nr:glycosyltransferase [Elusimicrobiota bacterium]